MTEQSTGFRTIERQSVVALAVEQIRRLIATGALGPGDRLPSERALSEFFGVSRPSVREAIKALAFTGIVEIRQGSGTYVSSLNASTLGDALASLLSGSRAALSDLMEVRLWLEVGAAERAAERITDEELAELERTAAEAAERVDDVQEFVRTDIQFHRLIHEASRNAVLSSLMATVSAMAEQSRLVTAQQESVRHSTLHEHEEIIAALQNRDPIAARRAMREHLRHVAPHLGDGDASAQESD
jgi:GntR family transcriptional repressor for pyruvate dehydrogenase complex